MGICATFSGQQQAYALAFTDENSLPLLQDMQRPLYMQPKDAIEYGIIDGIVKPQTDIIDDVMNAEQWDKQAGLVAR